MTTLPRTRPRPRSRRRWPLAVAATALLGLPACSSDDPAPAAGSAAPSAAATAASSAVPTTAPASPAATSEGGAPAGGETDVCALLTEAEVNAFVPNAGPGRPQGPGTCVWGAGTARSLTITVGSPGTAAGGTLPAGNGAPLIQGVRIGGGGRVGEIAVGDRLCTVTIGTGVPAAAAAGYVVAAAVRVEERFGA